MGEKEREKDREGKERKKWLKREKERNCSQPDLHQQEIYKEK